MFKRGTLVLVPFPFTDLTGSKVRPAVIISKGKFGDDVVVAFITTRVKNAKHRINLMPDDRNNLKVKSQIACSKIATVDQKVVLGELGMLSKANIQKLNTELAKVLGL